MAQGSCRSAMLLAVRVCAHWAPIEACLGWNRHGHLDQNHGISFPEEGYIADDMLCIAILPTVNG